MGVYLSQPETKKSIVSQAEGKMRFTSAEMQGWRRSMEDAAIHELNLGDGNSLFGVFDGHGGAEVSEYVRQVFVNLLKSSPEYAKKDYVKALDQSFMKMDQLIDCEEGAKKLRDIRKSLTGSLEGNNQGYIGNGTGCTANVILITPDKYIIANSGDSRSALCRDGKFVVFSQDHKPESSIEQERIIKAGGSIMMGRVNGGLNLTRSFGDFDYKRNKNLDYSEQMITCKPDIRTVKRQASDEFIIMGCDGIWEKYVDDSQGIIDIIKPQLKVNKAPEKILEDLLDLLLAKESAEGVGCDNMTAILITLK